MAAASVYFSSPAAACAKSCTPWEHVDIERGCLFLPDSKSGRKTVILNAPALAVLNALERVGPYVVPGDDPQQPRHDLKRPWDAVTKRAGLNGVRLHDLRHTYASFGAGGGLGLPIIGRLSGQLRWRRPRGTRTWITIRCGVRRRSLPGASQPRLKGTSRRCFRSRLLKPGRRAIHRARVPDNPEQLRKSDNIVARGIAFVENFD